MMNPSPLASMSPAPASVGFYRHLNHLLDRQIVPFAVNESMIVDFRTALHRSGSPESACYWLLTGRLAELALLCAGHYADCGEIGAAGDLLLNPRRIEIHLKGAERPIVKERHRRLSEQLDPGGLSLPTFACWFRRNAVTNVAEPALLPGFDAQLTQSGRFAEPYLTAFHDRMARVADAMRFSSTGSAAGTSAGAPSHRCGFTDDGYRHLGREVARMGTKQAYRSPYLSTGWRRSNVAPVASHCDPAVVRDCAKGLAEQGLR